ncbi:T9SS type A sorting domain-containing protein [candidate division KSB1 bacterium]|nr:T9SS type A sorting domain-containing protein [candidate division KSB1 bacterium]
MKPLTWFRLAFVLPVLIGCAAIESASAQTVIDTAWAVPPDGGMDSVWIQLPAGYDPARPPAILIWWHQLGARPWEMRDYTAFDSVANARGWIAATSYGPHDRHWNTRRAQHFVNTMLSYLTAYHPFALDSIYMIGGSMGSAAGQIWHSNNCGSHDFLIAATAGGSQIIDTERRQIEYLETEPTDTNRSMRAAFGGLPCHPDECQSFDSTETPGQFRFENLPCAAPRCDSIGFEYHRYSAVYLTDTTKSMHFNCAYLPVYNTWGGDDLERDRYGEAAQLYATLRAGFPAPTRTFEASAPGHGFGIMNVGDIADWLSQFAANPQPDTLSLTADEDDEYYWMRASVSRPYVFGRWGAERSISDRILNLELLRNLDTIGVDIEPFQLGVAEHLHGVWTQRDPLISSTVVMLYPLGEVGNVQTPGGTPDYHYDQAALTLYVTLSADSIYDLTVSGAAAVSRRPVVVPDAPRLTQAFPNPFNSRVTLTIESPISFVADLDVYSIMGQRAKTVPVQVRAGASTVTFDTAEIASGTYFVTLRDYHTTPLKIVLLK